MSETKAPTLKGIRLVELYKQVWTNMDKIIIFCGLPLLNLAISWELNSTYIMNGFVTDQVFHTQNLISLLPTVLYILQTALLPMYCKLSDIYGRAPFYTASILLYCIAFVIMATSNNYYTLVGGQIIYAFGYSGTSVLGPVTIGDLTNVVDRGLYQALYNLPSLISVFAAPKAADAINAKFQWRWGYGLVCIIIFVTALPVLGSLWKLNFRVKKSGLLQKYEDEEKETRKEENLNILQKIKWFVIEMDVIGSLLLVTGLALILLPLVLALPSWGGWTSGTTIGTLVAGVVAWALFVLWEWKCAAKPIIPLTRWESRTPILGVLALSTVTLISSTAWQFFTIYLVLSRNVTYGDAYLLQRGYNVMYILCELFVGYMMKRTRVWRPYVWVGVSLLVLGVGLMIPARLPGSSDAFVVAAQAVAGMGSGFLYTPMFVAIQSSVPHEDLSVATSMMFVGGSIAGSIGSTMAGTIWNNMLPGQLAKHVPGEYDYTKIVGSAAYAQALPVEQYNGVVEAYGYVQMVLSIISMCVAVLTFCFTIPMKSFGLEAAHDKARSDNSEHSTHVDETMEPKYHEEQKV